MKHKVILGFLCLAIAGLLVACGQPGSTPAATSPQIAEQTWRFSGSVAPGTFLHTAYEQGWAELSRRTGGRITVEPHYTLSLFKGTDILRVVRDGTLEFGEIVGGYVMGDMPVVGVTDLPFLVRNLEEDRQVTDAIRPILAREYEKFNIVPISLFTSGPIWLFTNDRAIRTVGDLKGLKVRVFSGLHANAVETMGASPVYISYPEVYAALQRGVVDAQTNTAMAFWPMKFYELQKYANQFNMGFSHMGIVMPKKLLESLPPDLQSEIIDWGKWVEDRAWEEAEKANQADIARLAEQGVTVVEISNDLKSEMAKLVEYQWDAWAKTAGPAGVEALDTTKRLLKLIRAGS